MEDERFDRWVRLLAKSTSRRVMLSGVGGTVLTHQQASTARTALTRDDSYSTDYSAELRNPERGMYFSSWSPGDTHTIVASWLYLNKVCDKDLSWGRYNPTADDVLNTYVRETILPARENGYKILFRPRYDDPDNDEAPSHCGFFHADTMERQINHIRAVANVLAAYKDAIAFIQIGYLGRWGEWNTSDYPESTAPFLYDRVSRNRIIDEVLEEYTKRGIKQHVELRRPVFAREALSRNKNARVGLHNDCFMSNSSDMGTYSNFESSNPLNFASEAAAKNWAKKSLTGNASFGGETCPVRKKTSPDYGKEPWRFCKNMTDDVDDPATLHMSYLNGDYAADNDPPGALGAISSWEAGECYDDIRKKLGYRFEVLAVEYTKTITFGQAIEIHVDVMNTGWSRMHKPREAMFVLQSHSSKWRRTYGPFDSGFEVENWVPYKPVRLSYAGYRPLVGTWQIGLWIPDPDVARLRRRSLSTMYSVRFATLRNGKSLFNSEFGFNDLGVSITVKPPA